MKRLILFAAIALLATNAYASPFNGPYVGLQGGYESFKDSATFTGAGAYAGDKLGVDIGGDGLNGGLFAGYGKTFGKLYLGVEAEGDVASGSTSANITVAGVGSTSETIKHQYDYAGTIRAGFFPADSTLVYARAGAVESQFNGGSSTSLTGLRLGLGTETSVSSNLTLRADWVYSDYNSYTYSNANGTLAENPTSSTFRVGLAYNF